ncbi:MAG TPA: polysaccharide biosynthesis protein GtrA [Rhodobacteraceae bacterium]|jgi:putative flippase GtrA|nr:GtrA family protein [Paracoccaceae bacterium]HBH00112.1 polysaccharide biosynthesis protein GtrA [Paracoccaceae bacterium]
MIHASIVRFAIVGMGTAIIYIALFTGLAGIDTPTALANIAAFSIAIAFQYLGHSIWTFQNRFMSASSVYRFAMTIILGLGVSTLIVSVVGPSLNLSHFSSALIVQVVLPVINYILFRFWVFVSTSHRAAGDQ